MTSELANLKLATPYQGNDTITTASGANSFVIMFLFGFRTNSQEKYSSRDRVELVTIPFHSQSRVTCITQMTYMLSCENQLIQAYGIKG
ncbi:hypothetical protein C1H46_018090 [Malus baccata]|uniref:Uncharacterized protein n=1 Tax=Malus baccata TaxID=106549 RepID=A0A540MC65_MALBA|nr:hypothetical protein C1H46_018090 [Malus baccata]